MTFGRVLRLSVAALAVVAGCSSVGRPVGDAPLRYRDAVFPDVAITRDLEYGTAPAADGSPVRLLLDLYQPAGDTVAARPAVVWAHGGGFSGGSKRSGPSPAFAAFFARLGYVAVSIDYRLLAPRGCSGGSSGSACSSAAAAATEDAKAAVRWLRANAAAYRIDPERIAIGGESAGAIMATWVGLTPDPASRVQGWISISGGLPSGALAGAGDAPGYLFAGTTDRIVPYQWSVDTAAALLRSGVFVVLKAFEGDGHVPYLQHRELMETQSAWFLYGVLDLGDAAR